MSQISDTVFAALIGLLLIFCIGLYVYCVVDIHKHKVKYQSRRLVWLNLIWGSPIVGCIIYLLNRKNIWRKANSSN